MIIRSILQKSVFLMYIHSNKAANYIRQEMKNAGRTPGHIYLEKNMIGKDTCAPMFTAALFNNSQDMEAT